MAERDDRALQRLQDPDGAALRDLAELVVAEATATPLKAIASPRWIASQLATALEALTHGDTARDWARDTIVKQRQRWADEDRAVRTWFPPEADEPLREMLARPWSPDADLIHQLIDQPAMRSLIREVLTGTLTRFGKRLRSGDSRIGKFGARAARRGRGLLGKVPGSNIAGNLGGLAENIVGTVAEEVEHQLDHRVKEHVADATAGVLRTIAQHIADPRHAKAFGDLRVSSLDILLDTPARRLAIEADKLHPEELVDVVLGALRAEAAAEDFVDRTEQRVAAALDSAGDGTLGAWLDEVGLRQVWQDTTTELVAGRLKAVVRTPGFESWWRGLFEAH